MNQRTKSALKFGLKIFLSGLAIYLVFRKIELSDVLNLLKRAHPFYVILAVFLFNFSKFFSAERLNGLFAVLGIDLSRWFNLKLYYIGMFYNLFLPGGIGGDGYKVYLLKKRSEATTKGLITAVFLDRLVGAAVLCFLALTLSILAPALFAEFPVYVLYLTVLAAFLAIPVLLIIVRVTMRVFLPGMGSALIYSLLVQLFQLTCAVSILYAIGETDFTIIYLILFLVSSLAAMLPISFGGVGLRELVFLYASSLLPIDETAAVSLGLLFFLITAISSLAGAFIRLPAETPSKSLS